MFSWLKRKILTIFGRIKISKYPMWLSYCPTTYKVRGEQYREAVEVLESGYVIGRGYDSYLDGYFIPGDYSHTCLCSKIGEWEQFVIHSMAHGVFQQDLIDFLRCDRFVIFKPKKCLRKAVNIAKKLIGKPYDFSFKEGNGKYYCHEMTAKCFPDLNIKPVKIAFGKEAYTIQSFIDSPDFEIVYEYNPNKDKFGKIV